MHVRRNLGTMGDPAPFGQTAPSSSNVPFHVRMKLHLPLRGIGLLWLAAHAFATQAAPTPELYVLREVTLGAGPDARTASVVLRHGWIEQVLDPAAQLPDGARVVDGSGLIAVPGFIDAYSGAGLTSSNPKPDRDMAVSTESDVAIDMRLANRRGLQPSLRAALGVDLAKDKAKAYREAGFVAVLSAPSGQILSGTSCLLTTHESAMRDAIARSDVFQHAALQASGDGYPSTLMGAVAHLHQFLFDCGYQRELAQRARQARGGPRPAFDPDLDAGVELLEGRRTVAAHAQRWTDMQRWLDLRKEFGLELVFTGGREAYRTIDRLRAASVPVVLLLEWGEEPKDPKAEAAAKPSPSETTPAPQAPPDAANSAPGNQATAAETPPASASAEEPKAPRPRANYEAPLAERAERRRQWEETRDCALRLHEAGIRFAFGTSSGTPAELLKRARSLVEAGLPAGAALDALTVDAAEILGVADELGRLQAGQRASLALWTKSPLEKDAQLAWLFVEGFAYEFERKQKSESSGPPAEGLDATGTWDLTIQAGDNTRHGSATITMEKDGTTSATIESEGFGGRTSSVEYRGHVSGKTMRLEGSTTRGDAEVTLRIEVELEKDSFSGTQTSSGRFGERTSQVQGARKPQGQQE